MFELSNYLVDKTAYKENTMSYKEKPIYSFLLSELTKWNFTNKANF